MREQCCDRSTFDGRCCVALAAALLVCIAGCPNKPPPPSTPPVAPPLRVMVVDDSPLGAAIAGEWLAHTESKLEVVDVTAAKAAAAEQLPVDVVIYPPAMLGQFAARDLVLPLDETALAEPEYARDEILPLLKGEEMIWGRRTVALPLGSPQLVLWYRADLLQKQNLQPPQTWQEYAAIVAKFADKPADAGDGITNWQAAAEPLADGWPSRLLLARAASAALHRDQLSPLWNLETLEPLIAGPPFVRALEELVAVQKQNAGESKRLTPTECFAKLVSGECALAIGWPAAASDELKTSLTPEQIGVVLLPGSREVYQPSSGEWETVDGSETWHVPLLGSSGRMASVTRASAQPKGATQFLLWLTGPAISGRLAPASSSTTVFRTSHFRSGGTWQAPAAVKAHLSAYGELLSSQQEPPRRLSAPRIPGEHEYMAALNEAVIAAIEEQQSATEALQAAAEKWQAITKARGVALQQRALRRSLGLGN